LHIKCPEKRLKRFYGEVARAQNRDIISLVTGRRVLDIGCGYGTLLDQLKREKGLDAVGIDMDEEAVRMAKSLYGIDVVKSSFFDMDFGREQFDTVILRDAIHHLKSEGGIKRLLNRIKESRAKEVIIFDPNPNWLVKLSRRLIRHEDEEAHPEEVMKALEESNFKVKSFLRRDVIAFPLSGGFVGPELVPNVRFIKDSMMCIDAAINAFLKLTGMQRFFCWRYIIYALNEEKE